MILDIKFVYFGDPHLVLNPHCTFQLVLTDKNPLKLLPLTFLTTRSEKGIMIQASYIGNGTGVWRSVEITSKFVKTMNLTFEVRDSLPREEKIELGI